MLCPFCQKEIGLLPCNIAAHIFVTHRQRARVNGEPCWCPLRLSDWNDIYDHFQAVGFENLPQHALDHTERWLPHTLGVES